MKKKMRQAEQLSRVLRDQSMNGLVPIEEARPRHVRNCVWQRGPSFLAVKRVVTVPKEFPFGKIALLGCSYQDLIGQDDASFMCILVREPRAAPGYGSGRGGLFAGKERRDRRRAARYSLQLRRIITAMSKSSQVGLVSDQFSVQCKNDSDVFASPP